MSAAPAVLKDGINTPKPVHSADRPKLNKQPTTPVGKWSGGGRSRSEQKKLNMNSAHRRVRSKSASRTTDDVKCNIQVSLRVRPFLEEKRGEEGQNEVLRIEGNKVEITANQKKNCFEFTNVLDVNSTQEDVYNKVAMPLLSHALRGINVCVFAYGQTGSGKTYSIIGDHNNPGLLQRFCEDLLDAIREVNIEERRLTVSFYEIYQEKVCSFICCLCCIGGESRSFAAYELGINIQEIQ
ncbi:unnamed protein product [Anisakis simplex]|uniref:Kinesin-like protein n=1 Tax=Anisakis simplex TaxID=6269 RepID=A0A0M3KE79_ANISI|nr:unnamed protein product [Anisakis simplex]